jgi:hypothetical protein
MFGARTRLLGEIATACPNRYRSVPIGTDRYWWVLAAPIGPDIPMCESMGRSCEACNDALPGMTCTGRYRAVPIANCRPGVQCVNCVHSFSTSNRIYRDVRDGLGSALHKPKASQCDPLHKMLAVILVAVPTSTNQYRSVPRAPVPACTGLYRSREPFEPGTDPYRPVPVRYRR